MQIWFIHHIKIYIHKCQTYKYTYNVLKFLHVEYHRGTYLFQTKVTYFFGGEIVSKYCYK